MESQQSEHRKQVLKNKCSILVQSGLLDAYETFLIQLAQAGVPQCNVYEFAAQSVLKFQKRKIQKEEQIKSIDHVNKKALQSIEGKSHKIN